MSESVQNTVNNPPVGSLEPFAEFDKLTTDAATGGERFGYSVSLSGTTAIIGAYLDGGVGSAYVFEYDGTNWVQIQELTASDASDADNFGWSVGISGTTAIVGSRLSDAADTDSGSAYIFEYNGTDWVETTQLTATDAAANDDFGSAVAISGTTAIVGARYNDDAGNSSGSAYIFEYNGTDWVETAKLTASDAIANDLFGSAVAIDGTTAIVGAYGDDDNGGNSGSAYIFEYNGSDWVQTAKLTAGDAEAGALFGYAVAISGNAVLVGARSDDHNGLTDNGSAYLFERRDSGWVQTAKLNAADAADDDFFGISVALDGNTAIIGASADDDGGNNSGSAYVFEFDGSTWSQTNKLTASDATSTDNFGIAVAVSNANTLVGAYLEDASGNDSGSAYLFNAARNTPVVVSGTPIEDGELMVDATHLVDGDGLPDSSTYSYQWQQFDGTRWVNLDDATDSTFTPGDDQAGQAIRVQVIYTDLRGTTETVSSPGVTIANVNDAPTAANVTLTTAEDTPYTFVAEDFNFADVDAGDTLQTVQITALPTAGSLSLNGLPIAVDTEVSLSDIEEGGLVFTPAADANGNAYASIGFRVGDGSALSEAAYTLTMNVTAEADPPTAADSAITGVEDSPYTFVAEDFNFADVDAGDTLQLVKITSLPPNGRLTLFGDDVAVGTDVTLIDIDTGNLQFIPATNANGSGYSHFEFQVSDGISLSTNTYTLTVNLLPVNDAPTAADGTVLASEDVPYAFAARDFNFADIDLGDSLEAVRITTIPTVGRLTLNGIPLVPGAEIDLAEITAGNLRFTPDLNANGVGYASFGFQVSDGELFSADTYSLTVDVAPVDDAPTATDGTITTAEDTPYALVADDFGFADIDAGDSLQAVKITALPTAGSLVLNGVAVAENDNIELDDITAGNLTFTPDLDANGEAYTTIGFQVSDGELFSVATYSLTVNVTPINDAPTGADGVIEALEDTTYSFADTDFSFADVDDGDSLKFVRLVSLPTAGSLTLGGLPITVNTEIPISDIVEGSLKFLAAANANGDDYATIDFQVGDGELFSVETYTLTVNVAPVNDAPTATSGPLNAEEDLPYSIGLDDFNFADVDDGDSLQTVRITTLPAVGQLWFNGTPVDAITEISRAELAAGALQFLAVENANGENYASFDFQVSDGQLFSSAVYTLTVNVAPVNDAPTAANSTVTAEEDSPYTFAFADFPFADVDGGDSLQTVTVTTLPSAGSLSLNGLPIVVDREIPLSDIAEGGLVFTPAADANGDGYASFGFRVGDGIALSEAAYTMTVNVTPVADAPTATDGLLTTVEDTPYTLMVTDFNFADVDTGDRLRAVKITSLPTAGSLSLNGLPIALNGEVPLSDIEEGGLVFTPAADGNGDGYASFGFQVSDGISFSDTYTLTVDVIAVADAPTAADGTVTAVEDTPYSFIAADFNFADVDEGDSLQLVQILSLPTAGSLTLAGSAVSLGSFVTIADLTAGSLQFTAAADVNGAGYTSFDFRVSDGILLSDTYTLTVDVTPTADAPTAADSTVVTDEDSPYNFAVGDFNFADVDAGDTLQLVEIITLPTAGSLTLAGSAVSLGSFVTIADIMDGNLQFIPDADANGAGYASFDFRVSDGILLSDPYTLTVDVTPTADAPTAADGTVSAAEDTPYLLTVADFNFADVDEGDSLQAVQITTLPTAGSLTLAGSEVAVGAAITLADINAGNLVFTAATDANGTGYSSFGFRVSDGAFFSDAAYTMTVDVTPVNDAPTLINLPESPLVIPETSANETVIYTAMATDIDSDSLTYSLVAGNEIGAFAVDPTSGEVTLVNNRLLDVELPTTPESFSLSIQVSDGTGPDGLSDTQVLSIVPADVNEHSDFNGDGFSDIVWRDPVGGGNFVWYLQDGVPIGSDALLSVDATGYSIAGIGDLDADGKEDDLVWYNSYNGKATFWFTETVDGELTVVGGADQLPLVGDSWQVQQLGDFDGDGYQDDLFWYDPDNRAASIWYTDDGQLVGGGFVEEVEALDENWAVDAVGDFDGDGFQDDLVWRNSLDGSNYIWFMEGTNPTGSATLQTIDNTWILGGASDFDHDLVADDLIWQNTDTGVTAIWFMEGSIISGGISSLQPNAPLGFEVSV
jgi:hypothetical protein